MNIAIEPGVYVVAVSGGVDSMSLLHALVQQDKGLKLVVAHYDHGIRSDSHLDRQLVQEVAASYGMPFVFHVGHLGPAASEEQARRARYEFLHKVRKAANARAILTAHHQDDLLETAIFNMLRGTKQKGLTSLQNSAMLKRPLLQLSKEDIRKYAKTNSLVWREDSTNADERYTRNYIRKQIMPRLTAEHRRELIKQIETAKRVNQDLDAELEPLVKNDYIDRKFFNSLPHQVARELMAAWLRQHQIRQFDQKTLERLVTAGKTLSVGKRVDIAKGACLEIGVNGRLAINKSDR